MVLRHTSSGWDGCLSAIAERRRTWRWSSARLKRDGLTRLPWKVVRVTGRIRVRQIIERDNINPAASFQKRVVTSQSRSRRKSVYDPECGDLRDGQGSTLRLYCRFKQCCTDKQTYRDRRGATPINGIANYDRLMLYQEDSVLYMTPKTSLMPVLAKSTEMSDTISWKPELLNVSGIM